MLTAFLLLAAFASMPVLRCSRATHPPASSPSSSSSPSSRLLAPLLLAFASLATHIVAVPLAGGAATNPARAVAGAVWTGVWVGHWVYWAGPLLAAVAVGLGHLLLVVVPEEHRLKEEERRVADKLADREAQVTAREEEDSMGEEVKACCMCV